MSDYKTCKWELSKDENEYDVHCLNVNIDKDDTTEAYDYCPYCGDSISWVFSVTDKPEPSTPVVKGFTIDLSVITMPFSAGVEDVGIKMLSQCLFIPLDQLTMINTGELSGIVATKEITHTLQVHFEAKAEYE